MNSTLMVLLKAIFMENYLQFYSLNKPYSLIKNPKDRCFPLCTEELRIILLYYFNYCLRCHVSHLLSTFPLRISITEGIISSITANIQANKRTIKQ